MADPSYVRWQDHTPGQRLGFLIAWGGNGVVALGGAIFFAVVGDFGWALFGLALAGAHVLVIAAAIRYGKGTIRNARRVLNDLARRRPVDRSPDADSSSYEPS